MMTMQMMNTAWESREIAQPMKAPVTKLWVDEWMILFGGLACRFLMIPSSTAEATADRVPNTPANPANKYVCCLPCPKS
jgi:hypothetical protein